MTALSRLRPLWREEVAPWLREKERKPLARQAREAWAMWRRYRYPPVQYVRSRLYRDDGRDVAAYVPTGLLMKLRHALNDGIDPAPVVDKTRFRRLMEAGGVPAVSELFATEADGTIRASDGRVLTREEAEALLAGAGADLFVKRTEGRFGTGAFVWRPGMPTDPIFDGTARIVQPVLRQCDELAALHPASLNTVRMDTLLIGGEVQSSIAFLRIGAGGARTDNSSQGGLIAPIDIATGRVRGPGRRRSDFDPAQMPYRAHPDTGAAIEGLQLPFWDEAKAAVRRGARLLAPLRTLGWDVALTPDGPVVVEANHTWYMASLQRDLETPLGSTRLGQAALEYHLSGVLPPP